MKIKITTAVFFLFFILSCNLSVTTEEVDKPCGFYNGRQLYTGPKGGCYYNNSNGNKTYVDRSYCKC